MKTCREYELTSGDGPLEAENEARMKRYQAQTCREYELPSGEGPLEAENAARMKRHQAQVIPDDLPADARSLAVKTFAMDSLFRIRRVICSIPTYT